MTTDNSTDIIIEGINGTYVKRQPTADECSVCLINLEMEGSGVKVLECGHKFHNNCINRWKREKKTCPICRTDIEDSREMSILISDNNRSGGRNNRNNRNIGALLVYCCILIFTVLTVVYGNYEANEKHKNVGYFNYPIVNITVFDNTCIKRTDIKCKECINVPFCSELFKSNQPGYCCDTFQRVCDGKPAVYEYKASDNCRNTVVSYADSGDVNSHQYPCDLNDEECISIVNEYLIGKSTYYYNIYGDKHYLVGQNAKRLYYHKLTVIFGVMIAVSVSTFLPLICCKNNLNI